ncbi:MAG: hypothetical protein WC632_03405 [Candidatus Margulisiibacteriota bacterium]
MKAHWWIKYLFALVGCVELAVGLAFIFWPDLVFRLSGIAPVSPEYIQLPAYLIMVFGLIMFRVARDPARNRDLIIYPSLFKAAFIGVVLYNYYYGRMSPLWIAFAGFDLVYLAGFIIAWFSLGKESS